MKEKKKIIISILLTLVPIIVGSILYKKLPNSIPTKYSFTGEILGYSKKAEVVYFLPLFFLGIHLFSIFKINSDPKKENIPTKVLNLIYSIFPYCSIVLTLSSFLICLNYKINMIKIIYFSGGVFFIILGILVPSIKQNYTIGIKLPCTLSNEENWEKTHKIAGKSFILVALILFICVFYQNKYLLILCLLFFLMSPIYSYIYFIKNKK